MIQKIKYYIPYELAGIRAISFIPLILSTFGLLSVPLLLQIILASIIIGSDIFDGKISRSTFLPEEKLRFRLTDTIIDKTGIIFCLLGLLSTGKIPISYFALLITYHTLLLGGGALFLKSVKQKQEENVQGLFISRLFTAMVGISILLCNNINMINSLGILLTIGMGILGSASLTTQFIDKFQQYNRLSSKRKKDTSEIKKYVTSQKYINFLERRIMSIYQQKNVTITPKEKGHSKNQNTDLSLQDIIHGFRDIEKVLSNGIRKEERETNIILLKVPLMLFQPPYEEKDILDYIYSHSLIDIALDELHSKLEKIKIAIGVQKQPSNNLGANCLSKKPKKKDTI